MRARFLLGVIAALLGLALAGTAHAAAPRTSVARVDRVSDGDTLTAMTENGTKLRIRLLGIDAPEIAHGDEPGQPYPFRAPAVNPETR